MSNPDANFRSDAFNARYEKRRRAEWRFRLYGRIAIALTGGVLFLLIGSILLQSRPAFIRYEIKVNLAGEVRDLEALHAAVEADLSTHFSNASDNAQMRESLRSFISVLGIADFSKSRKDLLTPQRAAKMVRIPISNQADHYLKNRRKFGVFYKGEAPDIGRDVPVLSFLSDGVVQAGPDGTRYLLKMPVPDGLAGRVLALKQTESELTLSPLEIVMLEILREGGVVTSSFNTSFFTHADSTQPELAGILAALIGSLMIIIVTMALALPIGVAAAIYLEEFAPRNGVTRFINANINNLAAVPSIVFGLLGAAVLVNGIDVALPFTDISFRLGGGMGRGWPLVGGVVLALMTLPTVIIASRTSIAAVPDSLRNGAAALGATRFQVVSHHVLPKSLPGIMTGSIIGLAQALGETAPLLLIGMYAFIGDAPDSVSDRSNALPVLIYQWSGRAERSFESLTAAAIVILLLIMLVMNALAIWIRMKYEHKSQA